MSEAQDKFWREGQEPRKERFAPGPWEVYDAGHWPGIESGEGDSIILFGDADEECGVQGNDRDTAMANAHLISAAPELYEALKHLYEQIGGLCERGKITESDLAGGFDDDLEEAVTALAKARGES